MSAAAIRHWQAVVAKLPIGEASEEFFWQLLERSLRLIKNEESSAAERQKAARDALYLFKALVAFYYRDKKPVDSLMTSYHAFLPTINEYSGASWADLIVDELNAQEVDLVLDAATKLTVAQPKPGEIVLVS